MKKSHTSIGVFLLYCIMSALAVLSFVQGLMLQWNNNATFHALGLYGVGFLLTYMVVCMREGKC